MTRTSDLTPGAVDPNEPGSPPEALISYVYAVGRVGSAAEEAIASVTGLDGRSPHTVCAAGLAAVVSSVPEATFGTAGLTAQLEDLERLEVIARTHDAVVETASRSAAVLPMRLATVYLDDTRVASMLEARSAELHGLLSWLEGHVELGVKVYADPAAAAPEQPRPQQADSASQRPGQAYLRRRQAQRRGRQDAYRAAGAAASQIAEHLTRLSSSRVSHRPQQGELASGGGENIANDAYLVPVRSEAEFRVAVAQANGEVPGVRIEVTGPWAPYSFVGAVTTDHQGRT
ncbi:GvpL/GvpF family gas vesicle protein [Streptomyces sp. NPDC005262]|uniref:GvpL/GvpF family gas vesicle protein n=1 Tax=Streptomyces sp. NPDC005262 TaxID=3364710 RepID=UPI0036C85020